MVSKRLYVLSIAGFDPSGGAGVLADVKTFESNKVYGLGVISANTFQNDTEFKSVDWISAEKIIEQITILQKRFEFEYVKIGLIENLATLDKIVSYLISKTPTVKIIWDPILKASAGFEFHKQVDSVLLEKICKQLYIITPNVPEALSLGSFKDATENAKHISKYCHVFLKGGHAEKKVGYDTLFLKEGKQFSFRPKTKNIFPKHGSGCVLSSALTANLAKGEDLQRACLKAKQYTERILSSNKILLGYHKI
ncbi:MAG TPA: hydroxymethylpyrimidine/phosphomethylpyrimidine kinase [Bacteroidia bacterium]|nr:hydroxymethylpyrimidine/phosphomethylpyrimidine kinase [Bacteroidia bacterium]